LDFTKMKNFCSSRSTIKKGDSDNEGKHLWIMYLMKGIKIQNILKNSTTSSLKHGQRIWTDSSP
jgi:hypothetical protein